MDKNFDTKIKTKIYFCQTFGSVKHISMFTVRCFYFRVEIIRAQYKINLWNHMINVCWFFAFSPTRTLELIQIEDLETKKTQNIKCLFGVEALNLHAGQQTKREFPTQRRKIMKASSSKCLNVYVQDMKLNINTNTYAI